MQQRSYAYRTLYSSILGISRFRHSEMKRKIHSLPVHDFGKQTHGLDHDYRVGSLDGYYYIIEIHLPGYPEEFHNGFDHSRRSIAISAHYTV